MNQAKIIPLSFFLILLIGSCNSSKLRVNKTSDAFQTEGYTVGIIVPKVTGNCGWVITVSDNIRYDPINIEEEKFFSFSFQKDTIYFKFLPLRIQNRCKNISPIKLLDVISYSK